MDAINIADLRDELDSLIDRLDAGESVDIVRNGQVFAQVTPVAPITPSSVPFDWKGLAELTKSLPFDPTGAGVLVRQMRDDARY